MKEVATLGNAEKIKVVYPKAKEELFDFLNRCKLKGFEVMLCPRCSAISDKKASKDVDSVRHHK